MILVHLKGNVDRYELGLLHLKKYGGGGTWKFFGPPSPIL